jgi:uncharacterized membrane protein
MTMNRWLYYWKRLMAQLWATVSLYGLAGVLLALAAVLFAPFVSEEAADRFGKFEAVEALLTILASSLLAVATFSLGAMVSVYTAVSTAATPRATALVVADPRTKKALSTFIGGFLFSIVALVAVEAAYYGPQGRAIIYFGTLALIMVLAWTLLRWTDHLGRVGRMSYILDRVEREAASSMDDRIAAPRLGACPIDPAEATVFDQAISATATGYVQNIDTPRLQDLAERHDLILKLTCLPGTFVTDQHAVARACGTVSDDVAEEIQAAFSIGHARTFDQDVRFGLIVLGEIAGKALSPAVNDPGTAIQVTGIAVRLLKRWGEARTEPCEVRHSRLRAPVLKSSDLLDDVLGPISRFGTSDVAASVRLQKALVVLKHSPDTELAQAATHMARVSLERSRASLVVSDDIDRIARAVADEHADLS